MQFNLFSWKICMIKNNTLSYNLENGIYCIFFFNFLAFGHIEIPYYLV